MTMEEILVSGLAELGVPATAEQLAEIPELNRRAAEDIWLFFHKKADSDEK